MKLCSSLVLLGLLCVLLPGAVRAEWQGTAEWGYVDYQRDSRLLGKTDASSFTQQYSLMWKKAGLIRNGKGGEYDLALGGEWTAYDTDINQDNFDNETKKILYRGELLLAPGGLPFRLHAYSYDEKQSLFYEDTQTSLQQSLLRPGITTDIANGQHITTGATLLVGIRNGHYLGRYRNVLSQLPRLLVDYKENYVRDVHGDTPEHYRERNLAFVSLNKKDNWFHYRYTDYTDFMQPDGSNDYVEKTYLLGTIDHQQVRRWINITNWIKISADGSYTTTDQVRDQDYPQLRRYDLNLFATMQRSNWNANEFTTFQRVVEGRRLNKLLEVPFFAKGELDRNTAWRFQFIGKRDREQYLDGSLFINGKSLSDEDDAYMSVRIETFRQGRYILAPHFEVEGKGGDEGDGYAARATFEFYSNSRYQPKTELYGSYSLARFKGNSRTGEEADSWEQEAIGRIESQVNSRVRLEVEQRLAHSSGTTDKDMTLRILPRANDPLEGTLEDVQRTKGSTLRATTTLRGEFTSIWRMDNLVELIFDFVSNEGGTDEQLILRHRLDYDRRSFSLRMTNRVIKGRNPTFSLGGSSLIPGGGGSPDADWSFEHTTRLGYSPGRAWDISSEFGYDWQKGDRGTNSEINLRQKANYNFYTVNGMVRKIAMIRQVLDYERFEDVNGQVTDVTEFTLLGEYYPTRRTLLGTRLRYYDATLGGAAVTCELYATANFEKLQVRLEYDYGTSEDADEQRWQVNVRKIF